MKLITFQMNDSTVPVPASRIGALVDGQVTDLSELSGSALQLIRSGPQGWETARRAAAAPGAARYPLEAVRLLAPLPDPPKIVAIGLNYMDHCREQNVKPPERPLVFAKYTTSVVGPDDPIRWDPALTAQVDYEAELGVIIGKTARYVSEAEALDYVFGYTCVNDVSARDLQFSDGQWVRAKSLDTFCPLGPAIVTADEIPDPQALAIRCTVNGEVLQNSSTKEMIFDVRALIAFLSRSFTLQPGDLISTGTPDGVGMSRKPKRFLQDGDQVCVEVEGIGQLENPVRLR